MNRKKFIKAVSGVTAGSLIAPYLLPAGTLFAPTGSRLANHVVLCLFAGGVRNFESVQKKEGNLMPHLLNGNESLSADIKDGFTPIPNIKNFKPLQNFGTLYKEFRYKSDQTTHFNAHASVICGRYLPHAAMMEPMPRPTIFELYRKHSSPEKAASNCWWVSDKAGPFPYMNYSIQKEYGARYGANMIQPSSFLTDSEIKITGEEPDLSGTEAWQAFFNQHYNKKPGSINDTEVQNKPEEIENIEQFVKSFSHKINTDKNIWDTGKSYNNDILNMYSASLILETFKPELLVVNMQDIDVGHGNFTGYCNNIRVADYALYRLWETIQNTPGLANDTVLIAVPEHGRNGFSNTIRDKYGRLAFDHTGDEISKQIFCFIAGPPQVVYQNKIIQEEIGSTEDVARTIARILGFSDKVSQKLLPGDELSDAIKV